MPQPLCPPNTMTATRGARRADQPADQTRAPLNGSSTRSTGNSDSPARRRVAALSRAYSCRLRGVSSLGHLREQRQAIAFSCASRAVTGCPARSAWRRAELPRPRPRPHVPGLALRRARVQRDGVGVVHAAIEQPGHGHGPLQAARRRISRCSCWLLPSCARVRRRLRPPASAGWRRRSSTSAPRSSSVATDPEHREVRPAEIGLDAMRIQERLLVAVQVDHRVATGAIDRTPRNGTRAAPGNAAGSHPDDGPDARGRRAGSRSRSLRQAAFRRALAHAPCGAGAPSPPGRIAVAPASQHAVLDPRKRRPAAPGRRGTPRRAGRPCRGRPR